MRLLVGRVPPRYITPMSAAHTLPLPDDLATCQHMVRELLATVTDLRATIEKQQAHIERLVRLTFGRRSERLTGPTLFDTVAGPEPEPALAPEPEPAPTPGPAAPRRGHGRRRRPADLPREETILDLTEAETACPCCGEQRLRIGADTTERLDYRPACLFVRQTVRPTYLCRACERRGDAPQIVQRPLPPEPIPRGTCAPGLLAHLIVAKYCDHLPLYRLEGILARLGWEVSRSTLCDQVQACARVLTPLYQTMVERVKQSFAVHADDTPVTLLQPRRTAHAWVWVGDALNPYTVFDLTEGRRQECPETFFRGYQGYLHADGYAGCGPLYAAGATHVGCWMHARRYFFDAKDSDPARAHEALARIRALYAVETEAKNQNLSGPERAAYRREHAGPILTAFADWLAAEVPRALPKSAIGQAIVYASNQWPTLIRYLDDGRLTIDNAPAEQALRPLAVGRRNWLHVGGDGGLHGAAVLLSLAASLKRHGLNPWPYLTHVLTELPARTPGADLTDLLPDVWADRANAATPAH
jgi:transposase